MTDLKTIFSGCGHEVEKVIADMRCPVCMAMRIEQLEAALECCPDHPEFTPADWREDVWNGDTSLGYRDWVAQRIAVTEGDES